MENGHGTRQVDFKRRIERATTALDETQCNATAIVGLVGRSDADTQGRRRGFPDGCRRPEEKDQRAALFRQQLQATQCRGIGFGQPGKQRTDTIGIECAGAGPGRITANGTGDQKA